MKRKRARWTMGNSPVSFSISDDQLKTMDGIAKRRGLNRSALLRDWIEEHSEVQVLQGPQKVVVEP